MKFIDSGRWGWKTVFVISGILGFIYAFYVSRWQISIEPSQVLAGVVQYPALNPNNIYLTSTWTLIHQIGAVFLRLGCPEIVLTRIIGAVGQMITSQAIALLVLAISSDGLLAVLTPLFMIFVFPGTIEGITYPVMFQVSSATYGFIGLSFVMLVMSLFGVGAYRLGAVLLGLSIAVHPSWGIWLNLAVFFVIIADRKAFLPLFKKNLLFIMAGYFLSLISLAIHLLSVKIALFSPSPEDHVIISSFTQYWDKHRFEFSWTSLDMAVVASSVLLAIATLGWLKKEIPSNARFILYFVIVTAVLAAVFSSIYWFPASLKPVGLLFLMPSRLFNVDLFLFVPLMIGILGIDRCRRFMLGMLSFIILLYINHSNYSIWNRENVYLLGPLIAVAVFILSKQFRFPKNWPYWLVIILMIVPIKDVAKQVYVSWKNSNQELNDRTNNNFFESISQGQGMLLESWGLQFIQLRSRRPILLDTVELNQMTASWRSAQGTEDILKNVYGISIIDPPDYIKNDGNMDLLPTSIQYLWETRTPQEWQEIKIQYGVTQIVTDSTWYLQLPLVARDEEYRLYNI